jgi:hypothetical protein
LRAGLVIVIVDAASVPLGLLAAVIGYQRG